MYGQFKRAVHLDFHTMPGIYNFNEKFDAEKFAERLVKSHVRYINVFARCNLGFAYYDTEYGVKYPQMKGDMFGDILRECHKRDIGVTAYLNSGIDHEGCRRHRDWCKVEDGKVIWGSRTSNSFRLPCYNTGYGENHLAMIREIVEKYPEVDGIFLDCINFRTCWCNECLERVKARGGDPTNAADVDKMTRDTVFEFLHKAKEIVGNRNLLCNSQPYWLMRELNTHVEIECLPGSPLWNYDFFTANAAYGRNIKENILYMSGRFQDDWGDFGGLKSKESFESDMFDAQMNAVECSVGDHMNPAENLDDAVYDMIGEVYAKMIEYEKWTDGAKYRADIGVIAPTDYNGFFTGGPYNAAARMLGELKYTFDIINETMDFDRYRMLILPDMLRLTPALKDKLTAYAAAGRPILSSGVSGFEADSDTFALDAWNGFESDGIDTSTQAFYKYTDGDGFRYAAYTPGIMMNAGEGSEVIAEYHKAYFNKEWDGFHGFYYLPPEKATGHAMAVKYRNVAHIAFKVFTAYYDKAYVEHKNLVKRCIDALGFVPSFTCEGLHSTARVTLTQTDENLLLHVKTTVPDNRGKTDVIEEHTRWPAGAVVKLSGSFDDAVIIPSEEKADAKFDDGSVTVTLPEINGYICIALHKVK